MTYLFDEKAAIRNYRKRHGVSAFRSFLRGSKVVCAQVDGAHTLNLKPCPICLGNDRLANVREGWGVLTVDCTRCGTEFLS